MDLAQKVVPAILSYNRDSFTKKAEDAAKFYNMIHFDIVDSSYAKQTWFDEVDSFEILKKEGFDEIVVHLMIEDPILFLKNKAKTLNLKGTRYLVSKSRIDDLYEIRNLKSMGLDIGIVFEPGDEIEIYTEHLQLCSEFLFLTVKPGKGGQTADLSIIETANNFIEKYSDDFKKSTIVSLDGGFNEHNAEKYVESYTDIIYTGSFIYDNGIEKAVKKLKNLEIK